MVETVELFAKQATVSQSNFLFLSRLVMVSSFEFHLSEIPSKIERDEVTRLTSGGARFSNSEILYTLGHCFRPRKEKREQNFQGIASYRANRRIASRSFRPESCGNSERALNRIRV